MKKKTIIILLILTLSIYASNINVQNSVEENDYGPTSLELSPHDPISITFDSFFEVFPGVGSVENPYIIEGYYIMTTSGVGIYITGTTKYFTVRNCYVDAVLYGIYIDDVAEGTATVINNTCNNNVYGIKIDSSDSSTVANNTCSNNGRGIWLTSSDSSTVVNNTCSNNWDGIFLSSSDSSTVINNTCSNNDFGIILGDSDFCVVTYNLLQENEECGVVLDSASDNNLIHHNTFVDNNLGGTSQACDTGTDSFWHDTATKEGNYWSDWSGTGAYSIDGEANSVDLYPLDEPAEYTSTEHTSVESTTDENQLSFKFTLLMLVVPLMLIRIISKKTKEE